MPNCIYILIRFFYQGDERLCTTIFYAASSFSLSIYSATHFAYTIIYFLSLYTHMLLLLSCYERWLASPSLSHIHLLSHDENLYLQHTTLSSMYFFFALLLFCLSLTLSLYVDSYLFLSYKRKKYSAWINFLWLRTFFSFFCILSIFLFFSSFCNRQMK